MSSQMALSKASRESALSQAGQELKAIAAVPEDVEEVLPPEVVKALNAPGVPETAKKTMEIYLRRVVMSGPIPPPAMIREYGEAVPGLDKKIVEWANSQHYARLEKESAVTMGSERRMDRAQRNFLAVAVLGLLLAGALGVWGNPWVASVVAVVAIGGPNAATILSRGLSRGLPGESPPPPPNGKGAKAAQPGHQQGRPQLGSQRARQTKSRKKGGRKG